MSTGPQPITRQRSAWLRVNDPGLAEMLGVPAVAFQRAVGDGHLTVFVADEPEGLHLSISHRTNHRPPRPGRYPTWDEISHARYELLPSDRDFVMHLPPPEEYVAVHDTTFHLHEHPAHGPAS